MSEGKKSNASILAAKGRLIAMAGVLTCLDAATGKGRLGS